MYCKRNYALLPRRHLVAETPVSEPITFLTSCAFLPLLRFFDAASNHFDFSSQDSFHVKPLVYKMTVSYKLSTSSLVFALPPP